MEAAISIVEGSNTIIQNSQIVSKTLTKMNEENIKTQKRTKQYKNISLKNKINRGKNQ